ncbi:MAG: putative peptidoglycan lipid flippase [Gaiellales bacterium]|nr:putative peptidoglycan lipid flippase [Gaiellales bacterium]
MADRRRLATSTAAFGAATAISRVAGLIRESVAAALFGASAALSAFNVAYQLPNLVRAVVADNAISAAFVPVFVELKEKGDEREAWRVAGMVIWTAAVVLGAISAIFILLAPVFVPLMLMGTDNISADLTVTLTRWLFPIVAVLGLTGIVTGILNAERIFGVPAFAPVIWNLVIILFLVVFARHGSMEHRAEVYAIGVLVATIVQFLIPLPLLRGRSRGLAFEIGFGNPHVRRVLKLMVPVSLGLGLINVNLTLDTVIATYHSEGAAAQLGFAFRLFMLPQGLFSVAVSTVLFPELARAAAGREPGAVARIVNRGMRSITFLLFPAGVLSIVLAEPLVRLLFEHGQFSSDSTDDVARALMAFSLGLVGNGFSLLLTRAFFSLQEPSVPTRVALVSLLLNLALDIALLRYGAAGIALATAIVTSFNALALAVLLRRRVGGLGGADMGWHLAMTVVATAYCAVAAFGVWYPLDQLLGRSLAAQIVSLGCALAAATAVYMAAATYLRLPEMSLITDILHRRKERR